MAVIGTFSSFTAARLGIYASQASLQVTGNNIANINTNGYTRQRADLFSINSTGLAKYASGYGVDIGYGVLVNQVNQLRDPYLDIRFRNQNTKLGEIEATLSGLQKVAQTLDEVNKGGTNQNGVIENALQEFESMLQELKVNVGSEEYDSLVREAAKSLTSFFNTAADKLQADWDLQREELFSTVDAVNKCLINIRDLNEQIRKQGIYGDNALELRDHRNLYIDELSSYLGIDVEYSMERIDQYTEVEKLTIYLKDTEDPNNPGHRIRLIDGLYGGQLSIPESFPMENPQYDPKSTEDGQVMPYIKSISYSAYEEGGLHIEYTDNPDEALQIPNSKFLPQIERLEDKFGRVQYKGRTVEPKESVRIELNDTDLIGSIQAMRELLTEEGEFAGWTDVIGTGADGEFNWDYFDRGDAFLVPDGENGEEFTLGNLEARDLIAQLEKIAARGADDKANIKKGIPYYMQRLDLLAQKIAEVFNEANQLPASSVYKTNMPGAGMDSVDVENAVFINKENGDRLKFTDVDGVEREILVKDVTILVNVPKLDDNGNEMKNDDGTVITVEKRIPLTNSATVREALKKENPDWSEEDVDKAIQNAARCLDVLRNDGEINEGYEFYDGGVLFSNSGNNNDPTGINARNISISNAWSARTVRVLNTTKPSEIFSDGTRIDHSSDNDNILHMISLFERQLNYRASELRGYEDATGGDLTFFHGSFQEMYTDLGATLGMEQSINTGIASNYEIMTLDLDNDRISVYGVDLNDEATGMMQFQKSYQAACKLLTTIDSILDTLINRTI